jgi:hypothetical protein
LDHCGSFPESVPPRLAFSFLDRWKILNGVEFHELLGFATATFARQFGAKWRCQVGGDQRVKLLITQKCLNNLCIPTVLQKVADVEFWLMALDKIGGIAPIIYKSCGKTCGQGISFLANVEWCRPG